MAEKQVEQQAETVEASPGRRKNLTLVGILLGVMAVEALVVVVMFKYFGPAPAQADAMTAGLDGSQGVPIDKDVEISITTLRAPNEKAGMTIYELTIFAVVGEKHREECTKLVEERANKIQDRFSTIVRESDPRDFSGSMEVVRGKFKNELAKVLENEEMVKEILFPKAVPYSAN